MHDFTEPADSIGRSGTAWQGWHLHLASADRTLQDRVVTEVIGPTVAAAGQPWFFMRYWQAGPHLRLRISNLQQDEIEQTDAVLRTRLSSVAATAGASADSDDYLLSAGLLAKLGEGGERLEVESQLEPGVYRRSYQPEFERYAGALAMPASERLFQVSSELVLGLLPHLSTNRRRSTLATQATMIAVGTLGSEVAQADYYARGIEFWRSSLAELGYAQHQLDDLCQSRPAANPAAMATADRTGRRPSPLDDWQSEVANLVRIVRSISRMPPGQLLFSHVHMLHNRLGLRMVEELVTYVRLADRLAAG